MEEYKFTYCELFIDNMLLSNKWFYGSSEETKKWKEKILLKFDEEKTFKFTEYTAKELLKRPMKYFSSMPLEYFISLFIKS